MTAATLHPAIRDELAWLVENARPPRIRPLLTFAEEEIKIPRGPHKMERFKGRTQPYLRMVFHLLDEMDAAGWRRAFFVGPPQSAKTFLLVIYTLHCLFERNETVIFAGDDVEMGKEKWRNDIYPVMAKTRYHELMPDRGPGSKGGDTDEIAFRNGANIKFMGGFGGPNAQASYPARFVVCTEIDKWPPATPGEADPLSLIEKRTDAYGDAGRLIGECTVTEPHGRIWSQFSRGTATQIVLPCPHCGEWVMPSREHLRGWQDATDEVDARAAAFHCPKCDDPWNEQERYHANQQARYVHRLRHSDPRDVLRAVKGDLNVEDVWQTIDRDGNVVGDPVRTRTLSFRWSAVNNMFWKQGAIGQDEYEASRRDDEDEADKDMVQNRWAIPHVPPEMDLRWLDPDAIERKCAPFGRGFVPPWTDVLTVGLDIGKHFGHVVVAAFKFDGTMHVLDYERFDVPSADLGEERGIEVALAAYRDVCQAGWAHEGGTRIPDVVVADCGWQTTAVYKACQKTKFVPIMGWGAGQYIKQNKVYKKPKKTNKRVPWIGLQCHQVVESVPGVGRVIRIDADVDHWKTWVQARLETPVGQPACATLYQCAPGKERRTFALHLSAERPKREWIPKRGTVITWESIRRANHYLDALCYAAVAAHLRGVRVGKPPEPPKTQPKQPPERDRKSTTAYILSGR